MTGKEVYTVPQEIQEYANKLHKEEAALIDEANAKQRQAHIMGLEAYHVAASKRLAQWGIDPLMNKYISCDDASLWAKFPEAFPFGVTLYIGGLNVHLEIGDVGMAQGNYTVSCPEAEEGFTSVEEAIKYLVEYKDVN